MISNTKVTQANTLYLNQFFNHFFERKSMLEALSGVSTGINVLEAIVTNFQNKIGIKPKDQSKILIQNTKAQSINAIQKQGLQISMNLQDLYQRLKDIFENWNLPSDRKSEQIPRLFNQYEAKGDDQLYQMLNDYKQENKKQKQLRKKAENECNNVRKQLQKLQDVNLRMSQQVKKYKLQIDLNKSSISQLEEEIAGLSSQIIQYENERQEHHKKISNLLSTSSKMAQIEMKNIELNQQLLKGKQRQNLLTKKFESLEEIIKSKIKEKDQRWIQFIEDKFNQKTIFQKSTCGALRQFMQAVGSTES